MLRFGLAGLGKVGQAAVGQVLVRSRRVRVCSGAVRKGVAGWIRVGSGMLRCGRASYAAVGTGMACCGGFWRGHLRYVVERRAMSRRVDDMLWRAKVRSGEVVCGKSRWGAGWLAEVGCGGARYGLARLK